MRSSLRILVLFIACLWGGCDCVSDEEQLAFIEEPVEARIVYVKKTGLKLEGGPHFVVVPTGLKSSHDIVLRVEGYDERSLMEYTWSKETKAELVSDEKGERLAYREKDQRWKIVYLLAKEHVFVTGALHENVDDWNKIDRFLAAAAHLFAQSVNRQDCIFEEVKKAGGDDEVARVLGETAAVRSEKVWDEVFEKLPKAQQKKVQAVLRKYLRHDADPVALERALRHLPLRDPALGPALLALVEKLNEKDEKGTSLAIALRAAALFDPKRTAELACGMIADVAPAPREEAFFALAHAKTACPAAEALLKKELCEEPLRCLIEPTKDEQPCDDSLWGKRFTEIAALDPAGVSSAPHSWRMTARAWAYRVKPPIVERTRARFGYAVDQPETPACHAAGTKGEPCRCDEAELRNSLCALGNDTSGATESCAFVIDDTAKSIHNVTSVAVSKLSAVSRGHGHGCGIAVDGSARCWGGVPFGMRPSGAPAPVSGWEKATLIASSKNASCAVADGKLSCLGVDVGPGTSTYELERAKKPPAVVAVAFDRKMKQLALAGEQGCLLDDGGRVHCWSLTREGASAPQPVPDLDKVTRIDGGDVSVVALRQDGTAFEVSCTSAACKHEKLGAGDLTLALRVVSEGVGIRRSGNAVQWLRAGPKAGVLEPIAGLSQVTALAHGGYRTCALLATHDVKCFTRAVPLSETVLQNARALSGGGDYITALLEDGSFVTWNPSKENEKPSRNYQ